MYMSMSQENPFLFDENNEIQIPAWLQISTFVIFFADSVIATSICDKHYEDTDLNLTKYNK